MLVNIPYVDPYGMCIHLEINPRKPTWITENEAPGRGRIPFGKHHFPGSFLGSVIWFIRSDFGCSYDLEKGFDLSEINWRCRHSRKVEMPMNKAQTPPTTLFDGHLRSNVGRFSHFEENIGVATEVAAWNAKSYRCILSQRFPLRSEDPLCLTSRSKLQVWDKLLVSSAPICHGWWKMFLWKFAAWKMIHFLFMANCLFSNCSFQEGIPLFRILPPAGVSALQGCISGVMGPKKKRKSDVFCNVKKKRRLNPSGKNLFWKWWFLSLP